MTRPDTIYLAETSAIDQRYIDCFGYLVSPRIRGIRESIANGSWWAMDNDCFNGFDSVKWQELLATYSDYIDTCLFSVCPDVVADYKATLRRFEKWSDIIRQWSYPVAFVSQDGQTSQDMPWDNFDCLFVGGSDEHKLGKEAGTLINEAIERNKWVHVGRVSSPKRMLQFWRANSWDGSIIQRQPYFSQKIGQTVRLIRAMKQQKGLFDD